MRLSTLLDWLWPDHTLDNMRDWRGAPPVIGLNAVAIFNYGDPRVKKAIWRLKYRGRRRLAAALGATLAEHLLEPISEIDSLYPQADSSTLKAKSWLIVPIPLTKARERARGFNQSAELARAVAKTNPGVFELAPRGLVKTRETPSQAESGSRAARLKNLAGAFTCPEPEKLRGRRVVLVDDVITTGATMREAARALRAAGVTHLLLTAIAHGE